MTWYKFWELPVEETVDPYIAELEEKGFRYDDVDDRWQHGWATVTKTGTEIVLEIRKKDDEGWWYSMVDNNGEEFYRYLKVKLKKEIKSELMQMGKARAEREEL